MNIEIHHADVEARIQRQIEATGARSPEEALVRLLETEEEQDRWLLEPGKRSTPKSGEASSNSIAAKGFRKTNWTPTRTT
jgi:hypothetical protein